MQLTEKINNGSCSMSLGRRASCCAIDFWRQIGIKAEHVCHYSFELYFEAIFCPKTSKKHFKVRFLKLQLLVDLVDLFEVN